MTQFHARHHFARVAALKAIQYRLTGGKLYTRETAVIYKSARYERICRAVSMYRVAGYLNAQAI